MPEVKQKPDPKYRSQAIWAVINTASLSKSMYNLSQLRKNWMIWIAKPALDRKGYIFGTKGNVCGIHGWTFPKNPESVLCPIKEGHVQNLSPSARCSIRSFTNIAPWRTLRFSGSGISGKKRSGLPLPDVPGRPLLGIAPCWCINSIKREDGIIGVC